MAIGDMADAAGLEVFDETQDRRLGYQNDNVRGDELADHMLNGGHPWSKITGKPSTFPPSSHSHPNPTWGQVSGKPSSFPPSSHGHSSISGGGYTLSCNSSGVHSNSLPSASGSWIVMVQNSSGYYQKSASRHALKQNFKPFDVDLDALQKIRVREFRWRKDVSEWGDEAYLDLGATVEDVANSGIHEALFHTENGKPEGIQTDRMMWVSIRAIQQQHDLITALTERIDALEKKLEG